jgi:Hypothetical glycosyl hydrolase family 15
MSGCCALFAVIAMSAPGAAAREGVHQTRHHVSFTRSIGAASRARTRADSLFVRRAHDVARCKHKHRRRCARSRSAVQRAGVALARSDARLARLATRQQRASHPSPRTNPPGLSVSGRTLSWHRIGHVRLYVVVRKVPGQLDRFLVTRRTSVQPPAVPGQTVRYSVRTAVAGSAWAPEVAIGYSAPASRRSPRTAPNVRMAGRTLRWNKVGGVKIYVLTASSPGKPSRYWAVSGTSASAVQIPGATTVSYSVRAAVVGSAWSVPVSASSGNSGPGPGPPGSPTGPPAPPDAKPKIAKIAYGTGSLPSYASKWDIVILDTWNSAAIARLKAANPNVKVLAYENSTMVKPNETLKESMKNSTATAKGYLTGTTNPWGLKQADIRKAGYTQDWLADVKANLGTAGWDGVFMDDFNIISTWQPSMAGAAWTQALHDLLREVQANTSWFVVPNMNGSWGQYADSPDGGMDQFIPEIDGGLDEFTLNWGDESSEPQSFVDGELKAMGQAAAAGKTYIAVTNLNGTGDTQRALAGYCLAAIGGASDYAPSPGYGWASIYLPQFDWNLGIPLGPYTQSGSVYTRKFSKATVTVNISTMVGSITLT